MTSYYDRLSEFAATLEPSVAVAFLAAVRNLAKSYKESEVADAIAKGDVDAVATLILNEVVLAAALYSIRESLREAFLKAAIYMFRDTPKGPPSAARVVVRFNALNPEVAKAAESFETELLDKVALDVKNGVLAAVREQILDGTNPRTAARALRGIVGLSDNQVEYLNNYRAELEALSRDALKRVLTDGNVDRSVAAAIKRGTALTPDRIDKAVDAYAKNLKAQHAETLSRTASINAVKEGQRAAWKQAIADGKVKAEDLEDTWHTRMDGRERPTHAEMNGTVKRFDEQWQVPGVGPQDYPGQDEYNCRCVVFTRPRIRRASEIAAQKVLAA